MARRRALAVFRVPQRTIMELLGHRHPRMTESGISTSPTVTSGRDAVPRSGSSTAPAPAAGLARDETRGRATPRSETVDDPGLGPVTPGM